MNSLHILKTAIKTWIVKNEMEPSKKVYLIIFDSKAAFSYIYRGEILKAIREILLLLLESL